jgi:hypothetical protein
VIINLLMVGLLSYQPLPPTSAEIEAAAEALGGAAVAEAPAVRTGNSVQETETLPPPPVITIPTFADNCSEMSWYRQLVGLPARFDSLGWRESNCRQEIGVRTSCCVGWWQLNASLHVRDHRLRDRYAACGVYGNSNVDGPEDKLRHACATKALYDVMGYSPWQT